LNRAQYRAGDAIILLTHGVSKKPNQRRATVDVRPEGLTLAPVVVERHRYNVANRRWGDMAAGGG
jgi:hypothetical protein